MEFFVISMLNGLSYGLLLFMLSSGLTLIFSMMGVLNFAHASFYMLGAYFGYTLSGVLGFWVALVLAPLLTGAAGALFESQVLRRVHKMGHVSELLVTFGLSYVVLEVVQLVWGRVAVDFTAPAFLQGPLFTLINHSAEGLSLDCLLTFSCDAWFHHAHCHWDGGELVVGADPHTSWFDYSGCAYPP